MAIPKAALDLIISFEGYLRKLNDGTDRVRPYICPAGVATIGYGSIRHYPSRIPVRMTDPPISEAQSRFYLMAEIAEKEAAFDKLTHVHTHELMRGAIVSFIYNCGPGAYRASTLRTVINNRDWNRVPSELAKWRRGGGRVLAGLVRRRAAEAALFMQGVRLLDQPGYVPMTETPKPAPRPKPAPSNQPGLWRRIVEWVLR